MQEILVRKENGELEVFNSDKLKKSLVNSGSSIILANQIVTEIELHAKHETTSDEIYRTASEFLKRNEKSSALRYSIRRSIINLGPTGFPFEKYIEKLFQKNHYQTKSGLFLKGKCIEHEIDVVAVSSHNELFLVEVKFHNELFLKSDVKTALYIKARFDDLKEQKYKILGKNLKPKRMILITNTKFTESAIQYGKCAGLDLISWDYPEKGNLHNLAYKTDTYPITILESLSQNEKINLLAKEIITCDDLLKSADLAKHPDKIKIISEVESINAK
jgi:Holliday junction resolvase-like predicted endonuclease